METALSTRCAHAHVTMPQVEMPIFAAVYEIRCNLSIDNWEILCQWSWMLIVKFCSNFLFIAWKSGWLCIGLVCFFFLFAFGLAWISRFTSSTFPLYLQIRKIVHTFFDYMCLLFVSCHSHRTLFLPKLFHNIMRVRTYDIEDMLHRLWYRFWVNGNVAQCIAIDTKIRIANERLIDIGSESSDADFGGKHCVFDALRFGSSAARTSDMPGIFGYFVRFVSLFCTEILCMNEEEKKRNGIKSIVQL